MAWAIFVFVVLLIGIALMRFGLQSGRPKSVESLHFVRWSQAPLPCIFSIRLRHVSSPLPRDLHL
jgi:hypothetical protein